MISTVNLPKQSVKTIVNIDNPKIEISIEEAIDILKSGKEKSIKTLFAEPNINSKFIKNNINDYNYGVAYINKIDTKEISTINPNIKYFNIQVKYANDNVLEFIVPGYVKFYSANTGTFVPVEFMKKSDLLLDYAHNIVHMMEKTELVDLNKDDFKQYYSIQVFNDKAEIFVPFYLNGILTYVYYNDYQKVYK